MHAPNDILCDNACCGVELIAPLLRCSKCRVMYYCCRACQRQAWKAGHKLECGQVSAGTCMLEFAVVSGSTDSASILITKMIELADKRIDMDGIMNHPWFTDEDVPSYEQIVADFQ